MRERREIKVSTQNVTIKSFLKTSRNTKFISAGGKGGLRNYIPVIGAVAKGVEVFGLRDRDQATCKEVIDLQQEGLKVLKQGQIEDYLLDDDVLHALCQQRELEPCEVLAKQLDRMLT